MLRTQWMISLLAAALLAAPPAQAERDLGIAAVVGGEAVSSYDVESRLRFLLATTRLPNTPDMLARIRPQVVRALVDEKLQLQEAAKNNITASDEEVEQAVAAIEQQRGMTPGAIRWLLEEHGVPQDTFLRQVRAQLLWGKLLARKVRPRLKISDEEIALARRKFSAPAAAQELKITAITLPVDKPGREQEVKRLSEKLSKEMAAGASFEEVARQFSAAGSTASFWVRPDQLDPAVARALAEAVAGSITAPVRTEAGYTIVKVYDVRRLSSESARETEVLLKEILLTLKADATRKEADVLLSIGEEVARHPGTCAEQGVAGIGNPGDVDIAVNFRRAFLADLPPAVKIIAESLKPGDISTPFASAEGIRLYMLCEKSEGVSREADPQRVANMLLAQKMELESQKYLRDLRRDTFIEIR